MNKISKICGIFAVGTMMLSTFFVTSCNSEDDFDFRPDSQYSLAERKITGENAGSNQKFYDDGSASKTVKIGSSFDAVISVSWSGGTYPMNFTAVSISPDNKRGNLSLTGVKLDRYSANWNPTQQIDVTINSYVTITDTITKEKETRFLGKETIYDFNLN